MYQSRVAHLALEPRGLRQAEVQEPWSANSGERTKVTPPVVVSKLLLSSGLGCNGHQ